MSMVYECPQPTPKALNALRSTSCYPVVCLPVYPSWHLKAGNPHNTNGNPVIFNATGAPIINPSGVSSDYAITRSGLWLSMNTMVAT